MHLGGTSWTKTKSSLESIWNQDHSINHTIKSPSITQFNSNHTHLEATMESMEVTCEEHLQQTVTDEKSTSQKNSRPNMRSTGSRKSVKTRFVDFLKKPKSANRGISAPASLFLTPFQRSRTYSSSSAPPATTNQQHDASDRPTSPTHQYPHHEAKWRRAKQQEELNISQTKESDSISIVSDNITVEGLRSVATNQTLSSIETVKASNKKDLPSVDEDSAGKTEKRKSPWKIFSRSKSKTSSFPEIVEKNVTRDPKTPDASRCRIQSYDKAPATEQVSKPHRSTTDFENGFEVLDQSIRGRLDGLDIMTLGSVLWSNTSAGLRETGNRTGEFPWDDTLYTVSGQSTLYSPAELIKDMLWNSGGREKPELILEGYLPGPEDRWSVQVESTQDPKYAFTYTLDSLSPPALRATSTDENTASTDPDELDDSPLVSCTHKLWTSLWGSDPIPSGQPNRELLTQVGNGSAQSPSAPYIGEHMTGTAEDPLLSLAASSSIPIDVDEDTFIVSTRDHLAAIQDIAAVPLSEGQFDTAANIFEKLLAGLVPRSSGDRKYLRGSTYHNIGLIHLWQGNYIQANSAFGEAFRERLTYMKKDMDLVVTQCRQAQCLFALEHFDEAIELFERCLDLTDQDPVVRSKILNNLAVVHYHKREIATALRYLAQALGHYRELLDGTIRRESIVYDTSVCLCNMGKLYLWQSDFELCSGVYEEALLLQTSIFQKENPAVMQAYINLAWSKALNGHYRTAIRLLESCLRVQTAHYGSTASATVETAGWIAHLYARSRRFNDALPIYQRIRQWQEQHLEGNTTPFLIPGPNSSMHPSVRLVKDCIKQIEDPTSSKSSVSIWL